LLRAFVGDKVPRQPKPIIVNGENFYEVDAILQARERKASKKFVIPNGSNVPNRPAGVRYEYLVAWRGFGPEHNEWVSEEDFHYDTQPEDNLILKFWRRVVQEGESGLVQKRKTPVPQTT
jgi:hypothetical protein